MKKNRIIFYIFFGVFHLFIFIFSLYVDSQKDNLEFLFSLQRKIWLIKFGSFIGLILLAIDVIWILRGEREHVREKSRLDDEMTRLKAKLFDLQEGVSRKPEPPKVP